MRSAVLALILVLTGTLAGGCQPSTGGEIGLEPATPPPTRSPTGAPGPTAAAMVLARTTPAAAGFTPGAATPPPPLTLAGARDTVVTVVAVRTTPPATPTPRPPLPTPTPHADAVIRLDGREGPLIERDVELRVGQTLAVVPPAGYVDWEVRYDPTRLVPLIAPDRVRRPGDAGWVFRADGAGTTLLELRNLNPPCPPGMGCAPLRPVQLRATVHVLP